MGLGITKMNKMYDDFKECDDDVCKLYARIDDMITVMKSVQPDTRLVTRDRTLVKLRSAKRTCEKTMMALIEAKERLT